MPYDEIVLPETKPETEWVRGRALQKVSPTYSHARLQLLVATALDAWNDVHLLGRVGTEWRFRVTPPGDRTRPLVPDVGYISYAALPADAPPWRVEVPLAAPTVAFEILSPGDRRADVGDKIETYLAAGTSLVVAIDPQARTAVLYDGGDPTSFGATSVLSHPALPAFELDLAELFRRAAR